MRNSKLHREILQRQDLLVVAKKTLKQEFFGIDNVIDEVVDAASSWFLFPDMQERPVVINLWGLTGVGKSSLVNRLAHLLRFEKRYYHFDLGDRNSSGWTVMSKMEEICDNMNGYPVLIALDEFQHARTLDESGSELYSSSSRIIWQLLDSGKFQISRSTFRIDEIGDLRRLGNGLA